MLANKATLGYKAGTGNTYTDLAGLKQIPEMGAEPTLVDNTCLTDAMIMNEIGIGDAGQLEYVFKFTGYASGTYKTLYDLLYNTETGATKGTPKNNTVEFQQKMADGTTYTFSAQGSLRVGGGGVNEAIEFTLSLALQSAIIVGAPQV